MYGYPNFLKNLEEFIKDVRYDFIFCFISRNYDRAVRLRQSSDIKGIRITIDNKTQSIKLSQLADDTTLCLYFKIGYIKSYEYFQTFGSFSGLKLKRSSILGIWIGVL